MGTEGWETLLAGELAAGQSIIMIDILRSRLGREPNSAELHAARRAAHRLETAGLATVSRARRVTENGRTRQVLMLSPAGLRHHPH